MRRLSSGAVVVALAVLAAAAAAAAFPQVRAVERLDSSSPVPYFIADGRARIAGYRPSDRELAQWALAAWERTTTGALRFVEAPEAKSLVRVYWAGPTGGQYGEMRAIDVNGRRGAAVYIRPDVQALGPEIGKLALADDLLRETIVYLTCLHELGHAIGLPHTDGFDDIMYSFGYGGDIVEYFTRYRRQIRTRSDIRQVTGVSDADMARLRALYPAKP